MWLVGSGGGGGGGPIALTSRIMNAGSPDGARGVRQHLASSPSATSCGLDLDMLGIINLPMCAKVFYSRIISFGCVLLVAYFFSFLSFLFHVFGRFACYAIFFFFSCKLLTLLFISSLHTSFI